jgi:hypothetical protein
MHPKSGLCHRPDCLRARAIGVRREDQRIQCARAWLVRNQNQNRGTLAGLLTPRQTRSRRGERLFLKDAATAYSSAGADSGMSRWLISYLHTPSLLSYRDLGLQTYVPQPRVETDRLHRKSRSPARPRRTDSIRHRRGGCYHRFLGVGEAGFDLLAEVVIDAEVDLLN